ncbi:MAG: hypothetical protein O3A46_08880 [Candidatus Poribacteria bacterium]|nr:hypothetical protein [Candidatus Poribacteria bacterium]
MRVVWAMVVIGLIAGCSTKKEPESLLEIAASTATSSVWELATWDADPSEWIPLPVGSVYGTPAIQTHDNGAITVTLMAWGVRFTEYAFHITDDQQRDIPILSSRTDEHRQVRENSGIPRERMLTVWIGLVQPEPDATMLNVSITPNENFSYSVKWDAVPLNVESAVH